MDRLRVALVGSGFIATQKHLPAWRRLKGKAKVVAICDVNRKRAEEIAKQFSVREFTTMWQ